MSGQVSACVSAADLRMLLLLLLLSFVAGAVSQEPDKVQEFDFGQEAIIIAETENDRCVFEHLERKCCFARYGKLDKLCPNRRSQADDCRRPSKTAKEGEWRSTYTVENRDKQDDWALLLPNFQKSDEGTYNVTCQGTFTQTVKLIGKANKRDEVLQVGSDKVISGTINSQTEQPQKCVITLVRPRNSTCCFESGTDENFCNTTQNNTTDEGNCRVKNCFGKGETCRQYKVTQTNTSCSLHLDNVDISDAGHYKITFPNHGEVDLSFMPAPVPAWITQYLYVACGCASLAAIVISTLFQVKYLCHVKYLWHALSVFGVVVNLVLLYLTIHQYRQSCYNEFFDFSKSCDLYTWSLILLWLGPALTGGILILISNLAKFGDSDGGGVTCGYFITQVTFVFAYVEKKKKKRNRNRNNRIFVRCLILLGTALPQVKTSPQAKRHKLSLFYFFDYFKYFGFHENK